MRRGMKHGALSPFFTFILASCLTSSLISCSADPWLARFEDASAWLLAVAEVPGGVIAVGGQPGARGGPPGSGVIVSAPDDGSAAQRQTSPQPGMLWWVHTTNAESGIAWACGENGTILRNGPGLGPVAITTPTRATLYGIWAFDDDDVWAVGGDEGGPGVVLHGGRSGFTVDASSPLVPVLFKIFATDRTHLFAVGEAGTLLRGDGSSWRLDPSPFQDRLLTVFGSDTANVWAVGGLGGGRLLRFDGSSWSPDSAVADFDALAGLHTTADELLIVGQRGFIATRSANAAIGTPFSVAVSNSTLDLHGALLRGRARYAVGGNLSQFGLQTPRGVLLQQGSP